MVDYYSEAEKILLSLGHDLVAEVIGFEIVSRAYDWTHIDSLWIKVRKTNGDITFVESWSTQNHLRNYADLDHDRHWMTSFIKLCNINVSAYQLRHKQGSF